MPTDPTPAPALVELIASAPTWRLSDDDARAILNDLAAADYQVLPPPAETRTEWGIWWHADTPDSIVLSEEMIGRRERAETRAKERIGDYGITSYTIVRSEHRVWPDGTTLTGPWRSDAEEENTDEG